MERDGEQLVGEGEAAAPSGSTSSSTKHTPRIAIQKVIEVVAGLSDYKRFLVEEIGFEGVLRIPMIQKINLKFSKFLMTKVDVEEHCIILLSSLEVFIGKEINELSSRLEKDSFKMAFVVFVMGNLFAPCTRHDHSTIDYWGAIKDAENIALFNWCKYSVNFLLEAVRKLKLEIDANITPNHLYGCHLFLQVFVLDNVELGIMNLKQTTIPRIHLFDGETLKRMILVCSARKLGKTIFIAPEARRWNAMCYTWHNYINEKHAKKKSMDHKAEGSANKYALVIHNADNIRQGDYINTDTAISNLAQTHGSNVEFSPGDYARWIQMQNPELAASPLGWALKQHNAKCVHIANEMKRNIARENIRFTKKLLQVYSNRPNTGTPAPNASYRAAGTTKGVDGSDAPPFELDIDGHNEASTPIKNDGKATAISPTLATKTYSDQLVGQLMMLNDEIGDTEGHIVFGQVNVAAVTKIKVAHTRFTKDPWSSNRMVRRHGAGVLKAIREWMRSRTPYGLARDWVSRPDPRIIAVSGNAIKSQICDGSELDHELGSLIFRRIGQMESHAHSGSPDEQYRLLIEPDFAGRTPQESCQYKNNSLELK
ncbi:hypothetical protein TRIUR3_20151 [Triticum urartu]|uniref:Uncharacterized protein n=1 Tax=Triticum urartu TaxID=4572 RepID=M7ZMW0_TRIUA|nr:hypothetical protein TRIUR3_20151 [Triticum urartu]